jgi:hypothetical protein
MAAERFTTLYFPNRLRLDRKSATAACIVAWILGIFLTSVPLVPSKSHWNFFEQTSICIPLPATISPEFDGLDYNFGVQVIFHTVLFFLVGCSQVLVCLFLKKGKARSLLRRPSFDMVLTQHVFNIILIHWLCWAAISAIGLACKAGVMDVGSEFKAVLSLVALHLPAGLTPVLYIVNQIKEDQKRNLEQRLLCVLIQKRNMECRNKQI